MSKSMESRIEAQDPQSLIVALGVAAGFSSGFLGIGGGILLIPALSAFMGYPIKRAMGTSLVAAPFIALAGVLAEWEAGEAQIRWTWVLLLGAGSVAGAALGRRIGWRIPDTPVRLALAGALLLSSFRMFASSLSPRGSVANMIAATPAGEQLLVLSLGILTGLTSVRFGLGNGIVTLAGLALFCADMPFNAIRGISLAAIIVPAAVGAHQHRRLGNVDARLARALVPPGLAGAVLGVIAADFLPVRLCQMAFGVLLVVVVVRLLSEVLHPGRVSSWSSPVGRGGPRADANAP